MASCVPTFASCHFGKNLATKTNHKTTNIMAPITQQASCGFASPPPPSLFLQRNGVTTPSFVAKRSAKIVAMVQTQDDTAAQTDSKDQRYTSCKFFNNTTTNMVTKDKHVWEGNPIKDVTVIQQSYGSLTQTTKFADVGSVAAVALKQDQPSSEIEWIVAWSNREDSNNQVYVEVRKYSGEAIDWKAIKDNLDNSASVSAYSYRGYYTKGNIDVDTAVPFLTATLKEFN